MFLIQKVETFSQHNKGLTVGLKETGFNHFSISRNLFFNEQKALCCFRNMASIPPPPSYSLGGIEESKI